MTTIAVVIPCYKPHLGLLRRCLASIEAQTVKPDEVIVICNDAVEEDIPEFTHSFPLRILARGDKRNPAQNRNQGAMLTTSNLISFFDADDIMHPQRIEFVKSNTIDFCVHSFQFLADDPTIHTYPGASVSHNELEVAPSGCLIWKPNWQVKIHHAHSTVARDVFDKVQFTELQEFTYREDCKFCIDIVSIPGIQTTYIHENLSIYEPTVKTSSI